MLHLKHCSIEWTDYGCRVVFPDGAEVGATPHPDDHHYHVAAHRYGCGDDVMAYCRDHELAHIVAAEVFAGGPSYVLDGLAHGRKLDPGLCLMEEMAALTIQRFVRCNEVPILAGCDWDQLRVDFTTHVAELWNEFVPDAAQAAA